MQPLLENGGRTLRNESAPRRHRNQQAQLHPFLVVADPWQVDELRQHHAKATNKASMVFTLPHTEGSLSQVLSILSFYNINLTKIQSLPIIGREWEYQFYVDVSFNDYLRYKQSIAAITPLTKELKILGEYAEGKSNV